MFMHFANWWAPSIRARRSFLCGQGEGAASGKKDQGACWRHGEGRARPELEDGRLMFVDSGAGREIRAET